MSSTNQSQLYKKAELKFLISRSDEERIKYLEEMIKECPKHKSSEKMLSNLKTRYKKLREKIEINKKKKVTGKKLGIKKQEMQAVLVGLTNSGKSSLLSVLTNARPEIASYAYTTKQVTIGTLDYEGTKIQFVDVPAIENELCNLGTVNIADVLIIVIDKIQDLKEIESFLESATENRLVIFNKTDLLNETEKSKISAFLQSKKYNFVFVSCKTKENLEELKKRIFESFGKIRIYTKQPRNPLDKEPFIMSIGSTVKDVAEKIFHGSIKIKEARITGPSSKFPNQKVGLKHVVKDKDIVEFYTK